MFSTISRSARPGPVTWLILTVLVGGHAARGAELTFTNVTATVAPGLPQLGQSSVAWGDYDNDGRLDFLLTGYSYVGTNHYVSQLWRNNGSGYVNVTATVTPGLPEVAEGSVAWADFDNDGRLDFLLTGYSYSGTYNYISQLWRNTGSGFTNVTATIAPGLPGVVQGSAAWGDYDNDGRVDLLLTGYSWNGANYALSQLWRNTASGFVNVTASLAPNLPAVYYSSVSWADYDGDGRLDFLITGFRRGDRPDDRPISQVWRNTGAGFTNVTDSVAPGLPGVMYSSTAWGDYDNDGRPDFLLLGSAGVICEDCNLPGAFFQLWRNTGSGFSNMTAMAVADPPSVYGGSVTWGDYNSDGRLDFLLSGRGAAQLWRNTGSRFTNVTAQVVPGLPQVYGSSVAWGDYDNDGRLAFLLTGTLRGICVICDSDAAVTQVWRNDSAQANPRPVVVTGLPKTISQSEVALNGSVNPLGRGATAWFVWGDTTNYGHVTAAQAIASGNSFNAFSHSITALSIGLTYYYRAVGSNDQGVVLGEEQRFLLGAPIVATGAAGSISSNSATLNGQVNPNNLSTYGWFEWGLTPDYGQVTPVLFLANGFDATLKHDLTGLQISNTYYFRAVASNALGVVYGTQQSLFTQGAIPVCPRYLSPTSRSHGYPGGSGYSIRAFIHCDWTVVNTNSWITITSPTSGPAGDPAFITYDVALNVDQQPRSGVILIGGLPFSITQGGGHAVILTQPADQTILGGGTATFSVTVTGAPPIIYQWQFNQAPLVDGDGVSGANTPTLTLSNVQLAQAGYYRVVLTNNGSRVFSRSASLTLSCDFSLATSNAAFSSLGATGSIALSTTTPACLWSVVNTNPWITVQSSIANTGNGTVTYAVAPNPTGLARNGTILIGDRPFTITQSAGAFTNASISLAEVLDTEGSIPLLTIGTPQWFGQTILSHDGVDAAQSGAVSDNAAVTVQGVVTGPGTLSFWWKVSSETNKDYLKFFVNGVQQTRISGEVDWQQLSYAFPSGTYTSKWTYSKNAQVAAGNDRGWLDQVGFSGASDCAVTLSHASASHSPGSETGQVNVAAPGGCAWSVITLSSWISPTVDAANGLVRYTLGVNDSPASRTGVILIGGQSFTVTQLGDPLTCVTSISPASRTHGSTVATGVVFVTTQADCSWSVVNTNSWISILSEVSGTGNGAITYSVATNPTLVARIGNLTIGHEVFRVTQAAIPNGSGGRWEARATGPERRTGNTAVWTGSEMIIWGGGRQSQWLGDGARYNLASDVWTPLPTANAPSSRWFHVAVWTGKEMIVWGGRASFSPDNHFNTGARYNPATDRWTPMSTLHAPSPRSQLMAVWTGKEMIVWGGTGPDWTELNDGGRYNPETDTWTPISTANAPSGRLEFTAVWSGTEMLVFGGLTIGRDWIGSEWVSQNTGGRYNPITDTWTALPTAGAPNTAEHVAVWSGSEMIVWGGRVLPEYVHLNTGARYNPVSNTWTPLPTAGAPSGRTEPAAVWTGSEMIVWAGANFDGSQNDGARYNPYLNSWTPMTQENAAHKRWMWRPDLGIWTGEGMLVYGGSDYPYEIDNTDYYIPSGLPLPPVAPTIVQQPSDQETTEAAEVSFSVVAGGTKPFTYQWLFGDQPIAGAQSSTLTLYPVSPSQEGNYRVVVSNPVGVVTSVVARLTVRQPRILQLVGTAPQQEGTVVTLPIRLLSEGDVGGMNFTLYYDPTYLKRTDFQWDSTLSASFHEVSLDNPGEIHVSIALPATSFAAGTQSIGAITFLLRSVPETLETEFGLEIQDLSGPDGNTLSGNIVSTPVLQILKRKITGDNNANDRLDIGDATVLLRYLSTLDIPRSWDVGLNDLNSNRGLDSGDVIRVLRASAGIDPQPAIPAAFVPGGNTESLAKALAPNQVQLVPGLIQSTPGQSVTVQVKLAGLAVPISGAAFRLLYNTNALRITSTSSYRSGALVPGNALPVWNLEPAVSNIGVQNGVLDLAVSSAAPWSTNAGIIAEVTFQVQPGATNRYLWPLTLSQVEITEDGYANHTLNAAGSALTVRSPTAARLGAPHSDNGAIGFTLQGDPGATYIVETSSDLKHWTLLRTIVAADTPSIISDSSAEAFKFFRVRTGP